jgi:pimeloyl-ACP methyl ester carboxylesterase
VWGRSSNRAVIRFVDADGVRLRTSVRGSGSPLLLITGLGASLDLAEPFERELVKRGRQVVSFDAPGVGESTPYLLPRRMRGVARTVAKMAAALGYDRMDVLGVSLGGVVAQQLARQSPDLVRRLILAATGPGLGGVPGSPRVPLALATPAATTSRTTTAASRRGYTAAWPAPTPTRYYAARSPASSSRPACVATSASSTRSPAGPACPGCTSCRSPHSSSTATTTRSFRSSTAGSSPGASPTPAYTWCAAADTCSCSNARPRQPTWLPSFSTANEDWVVALLSNWVRLRCLPTVEPLSVARIRGGRP